MNIVHFWMVFSFAGVAAEKAGFQLKEVAKSIFLLARSYIKLHKPPSVAPASVALACGASHIAPGCIPSGPVHVACWLCLFDEFENQRRGS